MLVREIIIQIERLRDEELNTPVQLSDANSLAALATYTFGAGQYWTLTLVESQDIPRDRPTEFRAISYGL